jgi:hypothetical protein
VFISVSAIKSLHSRRTLTLDTPAKELGLDATGWGLRRGALAGWEGKDGRGKVIRNPDDTSEADTMHGTTMGKTVSSTPLATTIRVCHARIYLRGMGG